MQIQDFPATVKTFPRNVKETFNLNSCSKCLQCQCSESLSNEFPSLKFTVFPGQNQAGSHSVRHHPLPPRILAKYQACHGISQLKISSMNLLLAEIFPAGSVDTLILFFKQQIIKKRLKSIYWVNSSTQGSCFHKITAYVSSGYTQYGPIKNSRIKNQPSDFGKK